MIIKNGFRVCHFNPPKTRVIWLACSLCTLYLPNYPYVFSFVLPDSLKTNPQGINLAARALGVELGKGPWRPTCEKAGPYFISLKMPSQDASTLVWALDPTLSEGKPESSSGCGRRSVQVAHHEGTRGGLVSSYMTFNHPIDFSPTFIPTFHVLNFSGSL